MPRLVIGATASGLGKTSLTIAIIAALRRRGLRVQAFKAGPDFLDPTYLAIASGRRCYNFDGWMCGRDYVEQLFARAALDADIAVIEGVMGLFDGADATSLSGSTAELALWLDAPVLLLINAQGTARSAAATASGFASFERGVTLAGIVANSCGSERHASLIREALEASNLPPLVGALAPASLPTLSRRHLGLVTANSDLIRAEKLDAFATAGEAQLSLDAIVELARRTPPIDVRETPTTPCARRVRIGVARDRAFHFYYPDNLEALEAAGGELVFFSPLDDARVPDDIAGLYVGGGYPEEFAAELAANTSMIESVRAFAASGRLVYAECGGLMYLSRGIETHGGQRHRMAAVLPFGTRMLARRKALGYVEAETLQNSPFALEGECLRGHEFHYSEIVERDTAAENWHAAYRIRRRRDGEWANEGIQCGNVLASYVHLHFASHPGAAGRFVECCGGMRP